MILGDCKQVCVQAMECYMPSFLECVEDYIELADEKVVGKLIATTPFPDE